MQKSILSNGLTLLLDKRDGDTVAIGILVKVGSNDERPQERGIAHFLEHMLFEGTTTKSAKELTGAIENVGGESNATTTNERTFFYAVVPKKHCDLALDMLADMFQNATFPQDAFEKEKNIIEDEIKMLHDDPKAYQWIVFLGTLFKTNRTRLPIYGDLACIKRLRREDLIAFYEKYYTAKNIIISVSGDIRGIAEKIKKAFATIRSSPIARWENPLELKQEKKVQKKIQMQINQSYIALGYKTPPTTDSNSPVLDVIKAILDRGQSSRLFEEIRTKRGLVYAVGAIHESDLAYGYFAVAAMTQKKNIKKVRQLFLEILQLPNLSEQEVAVAKEYVEGSLIIEHENNLERVEQNAIWDMFGAQYASYRKAIRHVTLNDVKRVVKKYFTPAYTETILEQKH
ncbi:MAG: pitrilysin family protein [Nanoarchaeota archaeon]